MELSEILEEIKQKQTRSKFIRVSILPTSHRPYQIRQIDPLIEDQSWCITLTNNPDDYFRRQKIENKKQHNFSFPMARIGEGITLVKGLYKHHGADVMQVTDIYDDVDTNRRIFLAVDILYAA